MDAINYRERLMNNRTDLQGVTNRLTHSTPMADEAGQTFGDYFGKAIMKLDEKVQKMDQDTLNVITGQESDLAQVMINMTEAQLTLQTATQIRNKALEAYNDIKNMQF